MPNKFKPLPPTLYIKSRLRYEAETGNLYWLNGTRRFKELAGQLAGAPVDGIGIPVKLGKHGLYQAHRLIWAMEKGDIPMGMEIDHIDGNPHNNRLSNLRLATSRQQNWNRGVQSNNISGLKGAYYHACHRGMKWRTQIKVGKKLIFIGYFHTAEEAHIAYLTASKEYFGEFHAKRSEGDPAPGNGEEA